MTIKLQARLRQVTHPQWQLALLLGLAIGCLGLFIAVAEDVVNKESIVLVDSTIADNLHSAATPISTAFFSAVTMLANEGLLVLTVLLVLYCVRTRRWFVLCAWAVIVGLGLLLTSFLKSKFLRPRPIFINPIMLEQGYSFPSGHAMTSMIAYGLLAYLICLRLKGRRARFFVILGFALLILLIGFSRIVLGVHYVSDVVGGFAAGGFWLVVSVICLELIRGFRANRPSPQDVKNSEPA